MQVYGVLHRFQIAPKLKSYFVVRLVLHKHFHIADDA